MDHLAARHCSARDPAGLGCDVLLDADLGLSLHTDAGDVECVGVSETEMAAETERTEKAEGKGRE